MGTATQGTPPVQVTVITATILGREPLLVRAAASVAAQTVPCDWLVCVDESGRGAAWARNTAATLAETEWLAFLDDDDELLPEHLSWLLQGSGDADVVYSLPDPSGKTPPVGPYDPQRLRAGNYIPVTALVRRTMFEEVGGFPDVYAEDWALWLALTDAGARFRFVPVATWVYHRTEGSKQQQRPGRARLGLTDGV